MERLLASVIIVSYNQERYIGAAIESVLKQKVNFKYELLIADDSSTDNTPEIIDDYHKRYPELIKVFHRKLNLGINGNTESVAYACKGKYIAVLEGDDFWSYDLKLQKQIDYLEMHKNMIATAHNILCIGEDGKPSPEELIDFPYQKKHIYGKKNAIRCEQVSQVSSLVFRNLHDIMTLRQWKLFKQSSLMFDLKISIALGMLGSIYYFDDIWSCRRRIFEGTGWSASMINKNHAKHVCGNCFKIQQYIEVAFNEKIEISGLLAYLLRKNIVSTLKQFKIQNIQDVGVYFVSYLYALKREGKIW